MLIKVFDLSDLDIVEKWLKQRASNIDLSKEILGHGYLAYSIISKMPIACGFLREHDNLGFIEGIITNPDASSEERNEAMDAVIKHLVGYAERQDIKKVWGYTLHENMVNRVEKLGFKRQPHIMVSLDLGGL